MKLKVRSRINNYNDDRDVVIIVEEMNGSRSIVQPFVLKTIDLYQSIDEPTIGGSLGGGTEFLQAALDHAWEIGLRPVGFTSTTNEIVAIKAHLSDMRALVFKDQVKPRADAS